MSYVAEITNKVIEVINRHRNDGELHWGKKPQIKMDDILYTYGSRDEFRQMIADLEQEYDITFEDEDIGEMTVQAFVDLVVSLVLETPKPSKASMGLLLKDR